MAYEHQVIGYIKSVEGLVKSLKNRRQELLALKKARNDELKKFLDRTSIKATEEMTEAYNQAMKYIVSINPNGQLERDKTKLLQNKLQGLVDEYSNLNIALVLSDEARANILDMLARPEEVVAKLSEFRELICEACNDFNTQILGNLDDFEQNVQDFTGHSERIKEAVTTIESEAIDHLEHLEECINDANSLYESTSSDNQEALVEKAFELKLNQIEKEISNGMRDVNGAIAYLDESAVEALNDIKETIGAVNDTLEEVKKITEPIKPVLEIASSIA